MAGTKTSKLGEVILRIPSLNITMTNLMVFDYIVFASMVINWNISVIKSNITLNICTQWMHTNHSFFEARQTCHLDLT